MSPVPTPPSMDPQITLIVTSFFTAIVGYAAARVGVKTKRIEKAPEVQEQINKAVSDLITHYTKALEQEKARHADHIAEMDEKLNRAVSRIDQLEAALRTAGIRVPPHLED